MNKVFYSLLIVVSVLLQGLGLIFFLVRPPVGLVSLVGGFLLFKFNWNFVSGRQVLSKDLVNSLEAESLLHLGLYKLLRQESGLLFRDLQEILKADEKELIYLLKKMSVKGEIEEIQTAEGNWLYKAKDKSLLQHQNSTGIEEFASFNENSLVNWVKSIFCISMILLAEMGAILVASPKHPQHFTVALGMMAIGVLGYFIVFKGIKNSAKQVGLLREPKYYDAGLHNLLFYIISKSNGCDFLYILQKSGLIKSKLEQLLKEMIESGIVIEELDIESGTYHYFANEQVFLDDKTREIEKSFS